jgi:O-antigen/teichoic acid export membrane protein
MSFATASIRHARLASALALARHWKGRAFFALADQGFTSATNFLLTILYAAWLPLGAFGQYVVLWTISLLIEAIQIALTIDALPALLSRYGPVKRRRLEAAGSWVTLAFALTTSIVLLGAVPSAMLWSLELGSAVLCLAAINPFQRFHVYMRRLAYIRDRSGAAAGAALLYCIVMVSGAFGLRQLDVLSVSTVLLLWGFGTTAAALAIGLIGRPCLQRVRPAMVAWLTRRLWQSGRWLTGAAVCYWVSQWSMYPLVAAIGHPDFAGILRALQNLFTPIMQVNAALGLMLLPHVADNVAARGISYARAFALRGTAVFTGLVGLYIGAVLLGGRDIIPLVYPKPEILGAAHLLYPLALAILCDSARQASAMTLLAQNRMKPAFVARIAAIVAFAIATATLLPVVGVDGILWANVIAQAVAATMQMRAAWSAPAGARPALP